MPHDLKLTIYTIAIKPEKTRKAEPINFEQYFRDNFVDSNNKENSLLMNIDLLRNRFLKRVIDKFGKKFIINQLGTKGITENDFKFVLEKDFIEGFILGGQTGIDVDVYSQSDATKKVAELGPDSVTSLPHYFKLWLPLDSPVGVLMIQRYTHSGVNKSFIDFLKSLFKENNLTMLNTRHVTEKEKEKFLKQSLIYQVSYIKNQLSKEAGKELNPAFDKGNYRVELKVSRINENPINFIQKFKSKKPINSDLSALGIDDNEDYDTILYYEDAQGRKSHAKLSNNFNIFPTIYLPNSLKVKDQEIPDLKLISSHTDGILIEVKKEIGYTPVLNV